MKRIITALAAICLTTSAISAQLLWKVSAPGSDKTSYIVGTHHVAPAGMADSITGLRQAINEVEAVYGELDMKTVASPETQQIMMSYCTAPADSTLDRLLTTEQLDSVGTLLRQYTGVDGMQQNFMGFMPALLNTQIAMMQTMAAVPGFDPSQQLDTYIQELATQLGKKTAGLETINQQFALLYGYPVSMQAADLMRTVRMNSTGITMARQLAEAYLAGDLDKMLGIIKDPAVGMDEETADKMIDSRNATWAEFLVGMIPTSSILIAVGAGHLPGEKGLLSLLQKSGFTISPVN